MNSLSLATQEILHRWKSSLMTMFRFRQPLVAGLARPLGVSVLVLIQWVALISRLAGRSPNWRGRSYAPRKVTDAMEH